MPVAAVFVHDEDSQVQSLRFAVDLPLDTDQPPDEGLPVLSCYLFLTAEQIHMNVGVLLMMVDTLDHFLVVGLYFRHTFQPLLGQRLTFFRTRRLQ